VDEVKTRKLEALQQKQYIDRLVALYEEFQTYIEGLVSALNCPDRLTEQDYETLVRRQEALRLHLDEKENLFLEWHDGEQVLNPHIFSLVREPDTYRHDRNAFRCSVLLATEKFEYLIRKQERSLRELHEQIALLTSEGEAQAVTTLEPRSRLQSTASKMGDVDQIIDKGLKWGGHLVKFGLWAKGLFEAYGHWH
jgi:hypothetical protein